MKNLTRRSFIGLGATAAAAAALVGCSSGNSGSSSSSSSDKDNSNASSSSSDLIFYTGGQAGTYYAFGSVLANHATNNADIVVTATTSDGSKANIEFLEDGVAQFGFCQSDVMAYAYNGTNLFDGMPIKDITTVAALYAEDVQIVTCDPDIKSVADLKGKTVSIGAAGSGVYFNALDILGAYDITEQDINPSFQSFGDSADALKNGQIDAAFIVAGAPTTAITDLSTSKQAYLVSLDAEHVAKLTQESPYYVEAVIPAGTYTGIDTDTITVAVEAVILAAASVPEDQVYAFVKDIFDGAAEDDATSIHAKYAELDVNKAGAVTTVPYHPGAAKYFGEQGITVYEG